MGQAVYSQQSGGAGGADATSGSTPGSSDTGSGDNVVDAEFTDTESK